MKLLGICGSPRPEKISATHKILRRTLDSTGMDFEIIKLGELKYSGCIACLGCAPDNVCKIKDDLLPLRERILAADAYVIASPNYYSGMTSLTRAFFERWFQFRHRGADFTWGKLAVAIGVGSVSGDAPADDIEKMLMYNYVKVVAKASIKGNPSCFYCGFGSTCEVGVPRLCGVPCPPPDRIPDVLDNPANRNAAEEAGRKLSSCLKEGYDRRLTIMEMQQNLFEKFSESV